MKYITRKAEPQAAWQQHWLHLVMCGSIIECLQVKTNTGHTVTAENVVLATNSPIHHNLAVHSRQEPYRSYVVGLRIPKVGAGGLPTPVVLTLDHAWITGAYSASHLALLGWKSV